MNFEFSVKTNSIVVGVLSLLVGACGSSSPAKTGPDGGAGSGGASSTGGTTGSGGSASAGGTTGGGGSAATGGVGGTTSIGAGGTAMTVVDAGAPTGGCAASALQILFNPMYSAYDGVHTFQIPAVVNGLDPTEVEISWSASDPSMVALEPDPSTGGVMITTQKAGMVTIYAQAGGLCGAAPLTITAATPAQWMAGSMRYNSGVIVNNLGQTRRADGGLEAECTSCHGDTAANGPFKTVQHTPEQTGGFSDADLINIVQNGTVPKGGYFDDSIVSYAAWQTFHKWDVGDDPQAIVVYLRSLVPAAQTGTSNFGGMFTGGRRDGGAPPRRDGGVMREAGGGQ
ncbi:MAG TPA: hypothetical protein VHJ20_14805 [Polyangia bacterium]|nr:hypothetical protein [Polyangia bacterium]